MRSLLLGLALFPSFAQAENGMDTLRRLYPEFSTQMIREKISNSQNELKFLRSLVAVFYDYLARDGARLSFSRQASTQAGTCMGDAHLENFGALLLADGSAVFTINDLDDSGPCPLAMDFLRFLVAAKMLNHSDADLQAFVREYVETIDKGEMNVSSPVEVMVQTAQSEGRSTKKSMLSGDSALVRPTDLENVQELTAAERTDITRAVQALGTRTRFLDGFSFRRSSGGSSGTTRYRVLAETPEKTALEFKQLQRPGIFPVAQGNIPAHPARIARALRVTQGSGASTLYQVATVAGKSYLLRPLWKGNTGVELSNFPAEQRRKVIKDEVQALALIHKRGADSSREYLQMLRGISNADWLEAVNASHAYMSRLFGELKH